MIPLHPAFAQLLKQTEGRLATKPSDMLICGLQHVLPSQEHLFAAIRRSGMTRELPAIMGKLYSTVRDALPPESYIVHEPFEITFPRGNFEKAFQSVLPALLKEQRLMISADVDQPVVILDDGGYVSAFLSEVFIAAGRKVVVVEQTTSGLLRAGRLSCPVVSVANSFLKREVESRFVAECAINAIQADGISVSGHKTWGVVGFGAVGAAVCRHLRAKKATIIVYDLDPVLCQEAAGEGFPTVDTVEKMAEEADVLLGCTGTDFAATVAPEEIIRHKGRLVCASCGSSDVEFARWIRSSGMGFISRQSARLPGNAFQDLEGSFGKGSYRVLNGGFPVNLNRRLQSDPEADFILTRMLMYAGILQSLPLLYTDSHAELIPIAASLERTIFEIWMELYPDRIPCGLKEKINSRLEGW